MQELLWQDIPQIFPSYSRVLCPWMYLECQAAVGEATPGVGGRDPAELGRERCVVQGVVEAVPGEPSQVIGGVEELS